MFTDSYIRSELKRHNYNLSKVSRLLGVPLDDLSRKYGVRVTPVVIPKGRPPEDITTLGKPGMEKYVIAVKANTYSWPRAYFAAINDARVKYDKGTHEMCQQKRPDGWIILYLIPRSMPIVREPYFFGSVRRL